MSAAQSKFVVSTYFVRIANGMSAPCDRTKLFACSALLVTAANNVKRLDPSSSTSLSIARHPDKGFCGINAGNPLSPRDMGDSLLPPSIEAFTSHSCLIKPTIQRGIATHRKITSSGSMNIRDH